MPDLSWKVVVVFIALLVSFNLTVYFVEDGWQVAQPLINMIGIIIAVIFAKDSVDKNRATRDSIEETAKTARVDIHKATVAAETAVSKAVEELPTKSVVALQDDDTVIVTEKGT